MMFGNPKFYAVPDAGQVFGSNTTAKLHGTVTATVPSTGTNTVQTSEIHIPEGTVGEIFQKCSAFNWKITGFPSLSDKTGDHNLSSQFTCCGATWNLIIYPNGINADSSGFISVFLKLKNPEHSKLVDFQISIKDGDGTDYLSKSTKSKFTTQTRYGWAQFLERSEVLKMIKGTAPDGTLTISCIILRSDFVSEEALSINSQNDSNVPVQISSLEILSRNLKRMFLSQSNCDVIINVQKQQLPAHRAILIAQSEVFAAMFQHDTKEKQTGEVEIIDFEPENVRELLLYMYCGNVEKLNSDNVFELYELSDKYRVNNLKEECVKFLESDICVETVGNILCHAHKYNETHVFKVARSFIAKYVTKVLLSDQWKEFKRDNQSLANEILEKIMLDNASLISLSSGNGF